MAGGNMQFVLTKNLTYEVRIFQCNVEQIFFACSCKMSCCSFIQMTAVVQLMAELSFFFPTVGASPGMRLCRIDGAGRVQIPIRFLRLTHFVNQRINVGFQLFIRKQTQRKRSAFNGFVNVCIIKRKRSAKLTRLCRGHFEVANTARAFTSFKRSRNGNGMIDFDTGQPKLITQLYLCKRNSRVRIIPLLRKSRHTHGYT